MSSTTYVSPDQDPFKSMQAWVAWGDAAGLAEKGQHESVKHRRREAGRNSVASWGTATLTVVAIVLPVISILVAVAVSR